MRWSLSTVGDHADGFLSLPPTLPGMKSGRVAPEPVLSDVVRQRLDALLAEIPARRAIPEPQLPVRPESADDEAGPAGPSSGVPGSEPVRGQAAQAAGAAWRFTKEHLAAVGVILLTGCLWAGYTTMQATSTPVAVAVPTVVATPTPTPTPVRLVRIHVIGAVVTPGVVGVPEGSRVGDAIEAAGGMSAAADPGELNLAAVLADGSQVVIGTKRKPQGEVRSGQSGGGAGTVEATINLNTATVEQLDTLPGVGPVTAQKILQWRTDHGRFSSVNELQEVDGIGPKSYADIAPRVRV